MSDQLISTESLLARAQRLREDLVTAFRLSTDDNHEDLLHAMNYAGAAESHLQRAMRREKPAAAAAPLVEPCPHGSLRTGACPICFPIVGVL